MKTVNVRSLAELHEAIKAEGEGALFRGQTMHFQLHGAPSFKTSFDRQGCIPDEMLKWTHFASGVLNHWFKGYDPAQAFSQAVLQHYGWRSFYLDATSKPSVAAWFASHKYSEDFQIQICEDHEERPALLRKRFAKYEDHKGKGHLYVFDKSALLATVGATDLSALNLPDFRPRFQVQSAWMIGPVRLKPLPVESIRAHIVADASILQELAAAGGCTTTDSLFPGVQEDPILYSFLSLPWLVLEGQLPGLRGFRRAVEFPEYQDAFDKRLHPNMALYTGARLTPSGDMRGNKDDGFFMILPTITYVGSPQPPATKFPNILEMVKEKDRVWFEVDYLARHAGMENTDLYGKGIHVKAHPDGIMEVGEIMVNHPGFDLADAGVNQGWHYQVSDDGTWQRASHTNDCQCGNDYIHKRHFGALTIIEEMLERKRLGEPMELD